MSASADNRRYLGIVPRWDAEMLLATQVARRMNNDELLRVQLDHIHFDDENEHPEKYDTPEKKIAAIMEDNGGSLDSFNVEMAALSIQERFFDLTDDQLIAELAKYGFVVSGLESPPDSDLPF